MDFVKELKDIDYEDLFDRLAAYAGNRLKSVDIRLMDGKEPIDLVSELFLKVLTGQRNAETATCSLEEFLFGCLKSDIDAFFRKEKIWWLALADSAEDVQVSANGFPSDFTSQRELVIAELRNVGADEEEILVFNIWVEGITKPEKVGTELGRSPSDIYRIQRRIHSHLQKIHKSFKALL